MVWHASVISILQESGIFTEIQLQGGKVRAFLDPIRFLDIHFDPESRSYSYALIDLSLSYPGDKRVFGWDDFPHPGDSAFHRLSSYPHHFQKRSSEGRWVFEDSAFRGMVEAEIPAVIEAIRQYWLDRRSAD